MSDLLEPTGNGRGPVFRSLNLILSSPRSPTAAAAVRTRSFEKLLASGRRRGRPPWRCQAEGGLAGWISGACGSTVT
jgi:hypothetical protein